MYNTKKSKAVKHVKKDLPPARTADEWLAREGLTIWPEPMPSEGELDLSSMEQRLETKDLLLADLKKHTCIFSSDGTFHITSFHASVWGKDSQI